MSPFEIQLSYVGYSRRGDLDGTYPLPPSREVSCEDAGQIFRDHFHGCVRQIISEVMARKLASSAAPSTSLLTAITSAPAAAVVACFLTPSVKPSLGLVCGSTISTGAATKSSLRLTKRLATQLQDSIVTALMHGVSTRDIGKLKPNSSGVGKSSVSRHWQSVGHEFVNELRGRIYQRKTGPS